MKKTIGSYYALVKPGVLYGNVLTAVAGFLLALGKNEGSFPVFFGLLIGISLVIGSACALNNYLDRDIDSVMERTKDRPTVQGVISGPEAIIFSGILGIFGIAILFFTTNLLTVLISIFGFIDYVWLYGVLGKRHSVHGTLIGSISGAVPILAGYTAVSGVIDPGAILVFLCLFFWQMPEFYSISIYRRKEYAAAGVPVISVERGVRRTKVEILLYTILFVLSTLALAVFDYTGAIYFIIMAILGLYFIWLAREGFYVKDDDAWARRFFHFTLVMLLVFSFLISIDSLLRGIF